MQKKYRKDNTSDLFHVYMHVFPNDKVYVGITSQDPPEKRWLGGIGYKEQIRVWRAIQKYGWENIEHIVVARYVNVETAINMEMDLIQLYSATDRECGYNASPGGWAMSEEGKRKLSVMRKGKKLSPETVEKISKGLKGKRPSDKAIERLREYNRTRDYSKMVQPNEAPVLQYDVENGNFINEYKSINRAAYKYGIDPRNVKCCIDEHVVQYKGYLWVDKKKATQEYIAQRLHDAQNPIRDFPIMLCNVDNGTIEYYRTKTEMCNIRHFKRGAVSAAEKKNRLFMGKYKIYRMSILDYVEITGKHYYERSCAV